MKKNFSFIFGGIFLFIGCMSLLSGLVIFFENREFSKTAVRAPGVVVKNIESRGSKSSTVYQAVVEFQIDGSTKQFIDPLRSSPAMYSIGEDVDVIYNPTRPDDAKINSFFSMHLMTLTLLFIGGVFSIIGSVFVIMHFKRQALIRKLKTTGRKIIGTVLGVNIDHKLKINDQSPYVVQYQFTNPTDGRVYVGTSDHLWFDPIASGDLHKDGEISILFNSQNPKENMAILDAIAAKAS